MGLVRGGYIEENPRPATLMFRHLPFTYLFFRRTVDNNFCILPCILFTSEVAVAYGRSRIYLFITYIVSH